MFDKNNKNELLDEHLTEILDKTTLVDTYLWIRAQIFLVLSVLVGGISVLFRPYFDNGVHVEALVALIIMIGMNIGLLIYFIRHKRKWYKFAYSLTTCAIWGGYVLGWSIVAGYLWDDVWLMNGMFAFASLGIGNFAFFFQSKL
jgi:hypothetical protein